MHENQFYNAQEDLSLTAIATKFVYLFFARYFEDVTERYRIDMDTMKLEHDDLASGTFSFASSFTVSLSISIVNPLGFAAHVGKQIPSRFAKPFIRTYLYRDVSRSCQKGAYQSKM